MYAATFMACNMHGSCAVAVCLHSWHAGPSVHA
jgi:hypothetical protein